MMEVRCIESRVKGLASRVRVGVVLSCQCLRRRAQSSVYGWREVIRVSMRVCVRLRSWCFLAVVRINGSIAGIYCGL